MLFFYVRHGDPIYDPDSLTPLGERQAEAVGKRLALYGVNKIYASTSTRAIQTAQPACEMLKKEMELLDFCNEAHAWEELAVEREGQRTWLFQDRESRRLFTDPAVLALGHQWYDHPLLTPFKPGMERIYREGDALFRALGYEHIRGTGAYRVLRHNEDRIALFAHQGFGLAFLSALLDIPYPAFSVRFDMCHTGMTVIDFKEEGDIAIPRVLTLSSDAHLYREGLPTLYNYEYRF